MILIADSGSTKTTWCMLNAKTGETEYLKTRGINPYYQDHDTILKTLEEDFTGAQRQFETIYFYGAGCANTEINQTAREALSCFFQAKQIEITSDLMAAAHALCGEEEGIACILGTGSNSCYYDGSKISANVSPLGFILGDEGSGAVIGKKLLADILKKQLPQDIIELFFNTYKTDAAQILHHIYKQPFPNRYAAGFTHFISEHISYPALRQLVKTSFDEFLKRNVMQYEKAGQLPIHFVGSIAWHFKEILKESLIENNLKPGKIIKDPMPGLIKYHSNH
ncbi:ATPase [Thermophagus xiamenensis]|uniref:BadF-type ATPase n=1 Tax=Thermophagus xiamenensis TaxID=385682 RepID=A0A1I1Z656_9BACT|nr:ATPase [Thermophagus xiamenensis]SFE27266.1 BadF-type ATPase [Thermophagus xiamenensis]